MSPQKVNKVQINGYIRVYGSEPFTFIGIVTDDEKKYTIQADEKTISELRLLQGEEITFYGVIIPPKVDASGKLVIEKNRLKDGFFEVKQYEVIKK